MKRNQRIAILLGIVNFLGAIWPVTYWTNRIEPFILGFPFFLFWTTCWIGVCFVNLTICYFLVGRGEGQEP